MSPDPSPKTSQPARRDGFEHELRDAMRLVRAALTELLDSIGADSARPQEMARRFGINRNMSWKLCRIVHSKDPVAVVGHLPGPSGLKILLEICSRHHAPQALTEQVGEAMAAFDQVVQRHAGDRARLEVLINAMASGASAADLQEPSRRQAFLGNAAIWGVQARLQFAIHIHVPSQDAPGRVDATAISGLLGFQRLRSTANWPLVRLQGMNKDRGAISTISTAALDPLAQDGGPPLVPAFSSIAAERLHPVPIPSGQIWELTEGPVGLTGTIDCAFARRARVFSGQWAQGDLLTSTCMLPLYTPVETAQLDLLVHRELSYADVAPTVSLFSRMEGGPDVTAENAVRYQLPVSGQLEDLGSGLPALTSPFAPRHAALTSWAMGRIGAETQEFRAWRLVLTYPPLPSSLSLSVDLPRRDGA